jgi:hypothetical protein
MENLFNCFTTAVQLFLPLFYNCVTAVQQLCSAVQQLYYSFSTTVLQLFYHCITVVQQQLYYSCSTTVLQLFYHCITAVQQLYYSCSTTVLLFYNYTSVKEHEIIMNLFFGSIFNELSVDK